MLLCTEHMISGALQWEEVGEEEESHWAVSWSWQSVRDQRGVVLLDHKKAVRGMCFPTTQHNNGDLWRACLDPGTHLPFGPMAPVTKSSRWSSPVDSALLHAPHPCNSISHFPPCYHLIISLFSPSRSAAPQLDPYRGESSSLWSLPVSLLEHILEAKKSKHPQHQTFLFVAFFLQQT